MQVRATVVVATVMLAVAVASAAMTTCEQAESLAAPCIPFLDGTAGYLTEDCCNGVRDLYEALLEESDGGGGDDDDMGFLCRCLKIKSRSSLGTIDDDDDIEPLDLSRVDELRRGCGLGLHQLVVLAFSTDHDDCNHDRFFDETRGEEGRPPLDGFSHGVRRLDEYYAHAIVRGKPIARLFPRWLPPPHK